MNRIPPVSIRRELRQEVGFGCPINGCGSPYLYWHHFDPSWSEREHHVPSGMIALCAEHHAKADSGAYTKEQLHNYKNTARALSRNVKGKFDWMRHNILAVVGGNFYYETPIIFEFRGEPTIWFNRDTEGYMLLNVSMLTSSNESRLQIEDNYWISKGNPIDLEVPPSGKLVNVKYDNGDALRIEFLELFSKKDFDKRYLDVNSFGWEISYPITVIEIHMKVGQTDFEFSPLETKLQGNIFKNCIIARCKVGLSIN
jgi:hypothetical protein